MTLIEIRYSNDMHFVRFIHTICDCQWCWLLLLLLPVAQDSWAQPTARFRHLNKKDGLSQGSVFAIAQDQDGFMWLGTRDGLNKYDGYRFTVYRQQPEKPGSLVYNDIRTLYFDPQQKQLWVGTLNGLSRYNAAADTFINYHPERHPAGLSSYSIRCLLRDTRGRLWVGTANGLNLYNEAKDHFIKITTDDPALAGKEISVMLEDRQGRLWLGMEAGLIELLPRPNGGFLLKKVLHAGNTDLPLADYQIKALVEDAKGNLWLGTQDGGVHYWDRQENRILVYSHQSNNPNSLSHNNVRAMSLAPDGSLWIGTFVGLNRFMPGQNRFQRFLKEELNPASISHTSVRAVFFDRRGGLWVGTYHGGVNYYDPGLSRFRHFEHQPNQNSLSNNVVSCFVEDEQNNFWIGTEGGGLNYWNRQNGTFTNYAANPANRNSLSGDNVKTVLQDGQQLWIGTFMQGLNQLDILTRKFRHFRHEEGNALSLSNDNVYSLLRENNHLWIATYGGGLNRLDLTSGQFHHYRHRAADSLSLSSDWGRVLFRDRRGQIWVGTEKGLNLVLRDSLDALSLRFRRYLPDVQVYSMYEDAQGTLWVGTFTDGLFALRPENSAYRQFKETDGLPGHTIFGIVADETGKLWLSTNNGLSCFDPLTATFINYNYSDGLQNLEFNYNAYYRARSGELLFGGTNGFTLFQPAHIQPDSYISPLVFTDLKWFNELVSVDDKRGLLKTTLNQTQALTFRYNEASFTIGFAALDYFNPGNNRYAFMLEGLDNKWNYTTGQTEANYTIQRPGIYTFRLRGANSDGVWNPDERQLKITVLPPPWRSAWAYLLYAVLLAGALYGVFRYISLQHRLQLEQLAMRQQEELSELKLRFFTNITHEFRTPLTLMLGPLEDLLQKTDTGARPQLSAIHRNAQRLLNLVNQILTFQKIEADHELLQATENNIIPFLRDIFESFVETAHLRRMNYTFEAETDELMVWYDADKLEKVFFNLLSNAFKFTPDGGSISLQVHKDNDRAVIAVEDTGNGIKPELHEQIFKRYYEKVATAQTGFKGSGIGLALSRQLVTLHHGDIRVQSEVGQGATFMVTLPLGCAHLQENEMAEAHPIQSAAKAVPVASVTTSPEPTSALSDAPLLLLVEDNAEVRAYLSEIFRDNYRLRLASNGREGLAAAQKVQPDLVISDVMMPEMDGNELCRQLKTDITTSHIPVVLLTARAAQVFKIEGLEIGADDYITKPFSPEELRLRVRNLIQVRHQMRERFARVLNFEPREIAVTSADEDFLRRAMDVAERHIEHPGFTAEQFAYELAVSRPLLFTKLKALTNQTPNNFMKTIRLKRAAQLLRQRKLNVSEVAYKVGFRDTRYFSKCFQEQFQQTPSEYKDSSQP